MFELHITAASHVGCVRTNNEDMLYVNGQFIRDGEHATTINTDEAGRSLIALADGMGGHNSGEVASSDVLHNLQFFFDDMPEGLEPGSLYETICDWLDSINNIIDAKGKSDAQYFGMGTTLVALVYYQGDFFWMNCGDSRFYRMRNGQLQQVSTDHSLSNLLGRSEHTNVITNCIGGGCTTSYIDMVKYTADVAVGDVFLLCSDGLSDMVPDATIERLLAEGADAHALCLAAEEAGGFDNVSAIVIHVK